ncbi:fungal-specific transcription factor domain-containing protein [Mycena amicta]|nr:fungal-specific transcription factor domain-containing protein [Mycena amicta]
MSQCPTQTLYRLLHAAPPIATPVDFTNTVSASKGACWTCRLRRKKCDENREGDSCHTCIRLTIDCLGWGPKRPEWMRDKAAVERYKADIKAQLTRAGLIRGQPRSSLLSPGMGMGARRAYPPHRRSADASLLNFDGSGGEFFQFGTPRNMFPGMPGANNSGFSFSDPSFAAAASVDFNAGLSGAPFDSPNLLAPGSGQIPPLDFNFTHLGGGPETFDLSVSAHSPSSTLPLFLGLSNLQGNHCIYYLEHVTKVQSIFAGNSVTHITCSMIVAEPRGAVTNAVCALASLHYTRMRVSHDLEAPDPNPEHSTAKYFHDEAYFQLHNAKQVRGTYGESDAVAALHLVWFSQLSGGATDWQPVFAVACDWLAQQTDLLTSDNPQLALQRLPSSSQLIVKITLWLDIFSSLTVMRPPKYLALYKRLFCDLAGWQAQSDEIRMDTLTGCPEEVLSGIAEVSALSYWKAEQKRRGALSNRDLIRHGDEIEQRLKKSAESAPPRVDMLDKTPLHPTLVLSESEQVNAAPYPTSETRQLVAKIFSETVMLYLHTVLSDSNPGAPEIISSVGCIVQYLGQLPPSEVDRALVFPIFLAGCMTDDSNWREFLNGRLQARDESLGDLMRTRLLMEAVWQQRDVSGVNVDWQETMREQGLNLLLV